jgi:uncharacterized protein (DUF58 family)
MIDARRALERLRARWLRPGPANDPPPGSAYGAAPPGADLDIEALLRLRHLADRMAVPRNQPRSALPGAIVHRRRGRGLELHDIRQWCEGDDIRHLDRNVMARTGLPHVRTFREERERAVLLLADFRPSMLFGTRRAFRSVAAAEALTLLGWRAVRDGGRVGLMSAQQDGRHLMRFGRGARAMIAIVGALAQAHRAALESRAAADPPLDAALEQADALAGRSGAIIVATALDNRGPDFDATAQRIALRRDLLFVVVVDAFEHSPPPGSYPYATAGGDGGWLRIGRGRPEPDAQIARLQKLGAGALALPADLDAERQAAKLERLDG